MALKRVLGTADAVWLVAGSMVGAGIFITPGLVAGRLPGVAFPLIAWVLGGLVALCGAAIYGELGSRLPRAGGDYQYLASAFGPVWGFLTGWAAFVLSFSAAIAAMTIVALRSLRAAIPALDATPLAVAWIGGPLVVLLLTAANVAGARFAGRATLLLTAVPVGGLIATVGVGLVVGRAELGWPEHALAAPETTWPLALGAAMIPVFFTYTGWNAAAYVAAEIKQPERNLARALIAGTGSVMLFYLLLNLVLLVAVPAERLAGSTNAVADAARSLLGPAAERVVSGAIAVAVLGTANVTLMAGSRIYYAMALDGLAPRALTRVNRAGVPSTALWASGIWTALFTAIARVEDLVNWATLAILLLSSLAVAGLFVLRRRDPAGSAYRCPGYPVTPIVYLVASLGVAAASAYYEPRQSLLGLAMVAAGFPVYRLITRR